MLRPAIVTRRPQIAIGLASLGLFLLVLLRYLTSLTQVHTFDALSYVLDVDNKPLRELFHPHHVAYGPLGAFALSAARLFGYAGEPAVPLQVVNALAGAGGVALFFLVLRRITLRGDVAYVVALLLGASYAYWYYAVEVEVYTVAVLFLIACLGMLARLIARPTAWGWAALGLLQGLAVLFHQTNVLLCAPVLVAWLLRGRHAGRNVAQLAAYGGALAAVVIAGYGAAAVVGGLRSWDAFVAWSTSYARTGWWGGPLTASKWADLVKGLADAVAQPGGAWFLLALLGLGCAMAMFRRRALREHWRLAACLACWLLVYGGFFLWWEPDNVEFWIASLPPALTLLALALSTGKSWGLGVWAALALTVAMVWTNGGSIAYRGAAANDLQREVSAMLAARSEPSDLLVIPDGLQELYLQYYERRPNFISLNEALYESAAGGGGESWPQACGIVRGRIDATLASGSAALIGGEVLRPPDVLLKRHRLAQAQVDDCFAPYHRDWRDLGLKPPLPAYVRIPTAQERATGDGWRFADGAQGWQLSNGDGAIIAGGWRFTPGSDPNLLSPLLHLDSAGVQAIEVRLANRTRARDAQLFYAGADGQLADARSVRWALQNTSEPHTYRVELRGAPGWRGTITRLRLDPVGVGDGGAVTVEWIRLIP